MPSSHHPVLPLAASLVLLLAAQQPWGPWLVLALVPLALAAGAGADLRRLLRRTRWLLLSLVAVFALGTPGSVWWPPLGMWVTREGLELALEHGARLVAVLAVVAMLLARTPAQTLAAGLLTLFAPLARLGAPVERAVARLVLVLRAIDAAPASTGAAGVAGTWRLSLASLAGAGLPDDALPGNVLEIPRQTLTAGERGLLALLGAVALALAANLIGGAA